MKRLALLCLLISALGFAGCATPGGPTLPRDIPVELEPAKS